MIICCLILPNVPSFAANFPNATSNQGIIIENKNTSEIEKIFSDNNSNYYIPRDNWEVPAIFLTSFPSDFYQIQDENKRNELFIQFLSPLALKLNQEILSERKQLEQIEKDFKNQKKIKPSQAQWLEISAKKYDVFTKLKGKQRTDLQIYKLKEKIDIIPPSILIAIAGIETNWGQSRFVKEGNALYKEIIWNDKSGIIPKEDADNNYSIKKFSNLYDSMKSFALKINSGINYTDMRIIRAAQRQRKKIIDGRTLSSTFGLYSAQPNFIGLLDYTITFYELINIDASTLTYKLPLRKKAKQ